MAGKKAWMPMKKDVANYLYRKARANGETCSLSYVFNHMYSGHDDYEAHYGFQGKKRQYALHIDKWGNQLR